VLVSSIGYPARGIKREVSSAKYQARGIKHFLSSAERQRKTAFKIEGGFFIQAIQAIQAKQAINRTPGCPFVRGPESGRARRGCLRMC
jgi:hypothetical protein